MHAKRILCLWCTMKTTNHMVNPICELVVTQNQTPSIDQGNSSVIITKVKFKTKRGYFYTLSLPVPTPKPTQRERPSTVVDLRVLQNNCLNLHALNSPTNPLFRMSVIVINRIPIRSRPSIHPTTPSLILFGLKLFQLLLMNGRQRTRLQTHQSPHQLINRPLMGL